MRKSEGTRTTLTRGGPVPAVGPALILPLHAPGATLGVLCVFRPPRSTSYSDETVRLAAGFTDQAALAIHLSAAQQRVRTLQVFADRDRIARDLHDHVIQRLSMIGLNVQGIAARLRDPQLRQRQTELIEELQQVIEEIRTTVFDLRGGDTTVTRLRQRLYAAVRQSTAGTDVAARVRIRGPLSVIESALARPRRSRRSASTPLH